MLFCIVIILLDDVLRDDEEILKIKDQKKNRYIIGI